MSEIPLRTCVIAEDGRHGFRVQVGDRYDDGLGADEALWCVVHFLLNKGECHFLKTEEEHAAWRKALGVDPAEPPHPTERMLPS